MADFEERGLGYMPSLKVYNFIKEMEGDVPHQEKTGSFRNGKFYLYHDATGTATIGFGHSLTRQEMASGRFKDGITQEEARNILTRDVDRASNIASSHFGKKGWGTMSQEQRDASIDFAFNLGPGGMKTFPRWSMALRKGDWEEVRRESRRVYKDSATEDYRPLSARNAAYEATFVIPHLRAKETEGDTERISYTPEAGGGLLKRDRRFAGGGGGGAVVGDEPSLMDPVKETVKDVVTQGRRLLADVPAFGAAVVDPDPINAIRKRLGMAKDPFTAPKGILRDALKTTEEFIAPEEKDWKEYSEKHATLSNPWSQFAMGMVFPPGLPKIPKGMTRTAKLLSAADEFKAVTPLSKGKELSIVRFEDSSTAHEQILHAYAEIKFPDETAIDPTTTVPDVFNLHAKIYPQNKRVFVNWLGPSPNTEGKFVARGQSVRDAADMLGPGGLRESIRALRGKFPFIRDDWTVAANRVSGLKARMAREDPTKAHLREFEYPIGRLTGKTDELHQPISYDDWDRSLKTSDVLKEAPENAMKATMLRNGTSMKIDKITMSAGYDSLMHLDIDLDVPLKTPMRRILDDGTPVEREYATYNNRTTVDVRKKTIYVNWLGSYSFGSRMPTSGVLEAGSNRMGAGQLREMIGEVQKKFPFIGDDWMVHATRIGGLRGSNSDLLRKGSSDFRYSVARLKGKKQVVTQADYDKMHMEVIEREQDIARRAVEDASGINPWGTVERERRLKDVQTRFRRSVVGKPEVRPTFHDWHFATKDKLKEANVLYFDGSDIGSYTPEIEYYMTAATETLEDMSQKLGDDIRSILDTTPVELRRAALHSNPRLIALRKQLDRVREFKNELPDIAKEDPENIYTIIDELGLLKEVK
jgi:GH24 family phage-related lysozyme (muramidase)